MSLESAVKYKRRLRAQLIFNPTSGSEEESPVQLMDIINELQNWKIVPETHLVESGVDLVSSVQDAFRRGIRMFVVCGGDGTIERVASTLVGTQATLGIIPTGTRNNVALSLGIPGNIPDAVRLLRMGERIKVDVGQAASKSRSCYFLETCSIGLFAALYPAADEIQHGNLARIGDFLATLISFPPARIRILMDKKLEIIIHGHAVWVANFPYVGPNYQVTHAHSINDGQLHILVFAEQSKLEMLSNVAQMAAGGSEDPRLLSYDVKRVEIETEPPMPVTADGCTLEEGPLEISVRRKALAVMAGDILSRNGVERD